MAKTQKKRRAARASSTLSGRALPWAGKAMADKLLRKPKGTEAVPGLTGYLVVWRHTMDDVPVGLFKTKKDAMAFAKTTSFRAAYATTKKLDIDCRTPVCFTVIEFDNGKPTEMFVVNRPDNA